MNLSTTRSILIVRPVARSRRQIVGCLQASHRVPVELGHLPACRGSPFGVAAGSHASSGTAAFAARSWSFTLA
jgi:hypothetical protein